MPNPTLENLIMNCEVKRIASPFQCLSLKEKVSQYLLTSENIRFGQQLEEITKDVLCFFGANFDEMPRRIDGYDFDQLCFYGDNKIILIEQKVRDDHDSTKKVGQLQNFIAKKELVEGLYPNMEIISCMWFTDPTFAKNKNYYSQHIGKQLFYGEGLFQHFTQTVTPAFSNAWALFLTRLREAKEEIHQKTSSEKLFSQPIDISKVSPSRLYEFMSIAPSEEIKEVFFAGLDPSEEMRQYYSEKTTKNLKVQQLLELISNGYFK